MRLAASNIAWAAAEQPEILPILREGGVTGIEVAPTMVWPGWEGATPQAATALRRALSDEGFCVPALQSLLFARPDLLVFGDQASRDGLVAHIGRVAALAGALGAGAMVFGSPRNRLRGALAAGQAMDQAVPLFRTLGAVCADAGTSLAIEANPPQYGGDFLLRWSDAAELVARVDHPGITLHLDTACTTLADDDPVQAAKATAARLRHFHVSAPQLAPVDAASPLPHRAIGDALCAGGYAGWVSLEMRRSDTPLDAVRRAVAHLKACYA